MRGAVRDIDTAAQATACRCEAMELSVACASAAIAQRREGIAAAFEAGQHALECVFAATDIAAEAREQARR